MLPDETLAYIVELSDERIDILDIDVLDPLAVPALSDTDMLVEIERERVTVEVDDPVMADDVISGSYVVKEDELRILVVPDE